MTNPPPYNPVQPGTPPPAPKKSGAGLVVGIILAVLLLVCVICGAAGFYLFVKADEVVDNVNDAIASAGAIDPITTEPAKSGPHAVRYEIEGTGEAIITWALGVGGQDSETVTLPWSKEISIDVSAAGLQVFAFATGDGDIKSCKILVDGNEIDQADALGNGQTVICTTVFQE